MQFVKKNSSSNVLYLHFINIIINLFDVNRVEYSIVNHISSVSSTKNHWKFDSEHFFYWILIVNFFWIKSLIVYSTVSSFWRIFLKLKFFLLLKNVPEFKITPFSLINTESQGCRVWIPTFYQIAAITHTVGEPWKDKKNGNTILYDYNVTKCSWVNICDS